MIRRRDLEDQRNEALASLNVAQLEAGRALERAELLERAAELERDRARRAEEAHVAARERIAELESERELGWVAFVRRRVVVNTIDGSAFDGILWDGRGPIVLRDAHVLGEHGQPLASPAKLDGEAIIDFARVAWVQAPAADG